MRSIHLSAFYCLFVVTLAGSALATPNETSVCVEVVIKRPKIKAPPSQESQESHTNSAGTNAKEASKPTDDTTSAESGLPNNGAAKSLSAVASFEPSPVQASPTTAPTVPNVITVTGTYPDISGSSTDSSTDPRLRSGALLPLGQTPNVYLKRLFEHYVTHERGFVAASEGCTQHLVVELYPLQVGWTAFARYTGNGREERVDQLLPTELSQFAERAATALLHDVNIGETIDRDNVLWSDSLHSTERIRGRNHFVLGLGTRLRGGYFDTAITDTSSANYGRTERSLRLFSPMAVMTGYRGVFDQYGVEALAQFDLGTSQVAAKNNAAGGHIDYAGSLGLVLHVTRYADPRGIASLYYGGGATFELLWFNAIVPAANIGSDSRSTLMGGGLNADAVVGYEFMRASAISFFLQGELNIPAYMLKSENSAGAINTWFPGMKLALGANF